MSHLRHAACEGGADPTAYRGAANTCRPGAAKEFPGPLRVSGYAIGFALTDLHGGGSEVNEPLNKSGFCSGPAEGVPDGFPCLVRFPVPAAVEEVERVEPLLVGGERGGMNVASVGLEALEETLSRSRALETASLITACP